MTIRGAARKVRPKRNIILPSNTSGDGIEGNKRHFVMDYDFCALRQRFDSAPDKQEGGQVHLSIDSFGHFRGKY